jgi:hypothetical protein
MQPPVSNKQTDTLRQNNSIINDFEINQGTSMNASGGTRPSSSIDNFLDDNSFSLSGPLNSFIDLPGTIDWVGLFWLDVRDEQNIPFAFNYCFIVHC